MSVVESMAFLYSDLTEVSPYLKARKKFYTPEAWTKMINALKTVINYYCINHFLDYDLLTFMDGCFVNT